METCLFCKMIENTIPVNRVYEDAYTIVIRDINPQAPYHFLVIPRNHYPGIHHVPQSESALFTNLLTAVQAVIRQENLTQQGYRLVVNSGEPAGQSVDHIHLHILSGRDFSWPPG